MSEDGWGGNPDPKSILIAYEQVDLELEERPVTKKVVEKDPPKLPPQLITKGSDVVYMPDDSDSDDDVASGRKPTYFRPPLQVQRNQFVRNTLMRFKNDIFKKDYHKMAVLGCGELSLERFLAHELSKLSIHRVVSVDIDEEALAKGRRLMDGHLAQHANSIKGFDRYPVLIEEYWGDILKYESRLAGTSCVCSTEVIEHISEAEAEVFVRTVLGKVRPRLFILSTPNHEYNEAFDMKPGEFRHDDHKYEFTREQFKEWIHRILADYADYRHTIHLVGNMHGFYHFGGATQFAVIWADEPLSPVPDADRPFEKVGSHVVFDGLNPVVLAQGSMALKQWLGSHELTPANLVKTEYAEFWRIDLDELMEMMALPKTVREEIKEDRLLKMLTALTRNRLFSKFCDIGSPDKSHLIIPHDENIASIAASLH